MDHTVQVQRIMEAGCKPEDWLAYLSRLEMDPRLIDTTNRYRAMCSAYNSALRQIALDKNKANMAYAHICINFAKLKSSHDPDDTRMFFKYARANIKTLSIVHVEAAQFELDQGDKDKCLDILKKAANLNAEPQQLVATALRRLTMGHTSLQSDDRGDPERTGELRTQELNSHSKPPVASNYKRSAERTKPPISTTQPLSRLSTFPLTTSQLTGQSTSQSSSQSSSVQITRQGQATLPGQPPRPPLSHTKRDIAAQNQTPIIHEEVDSIVSFGRSAGNRKRQSSGASSSDDGDTIPWLFNKTREAPRPVAPSGSVMSQSACKPSRADICTPDCKNLPLFSSLSEASRRENRPNYGQARRVKPTSLQLLYTAPTNPDDSDDDFPFPDITPLEKTLPTNGDLRTGDLEVNNLNDLKILKISDPRNNDPRTTDPRVNDRRSNEPKIERLTAILESPRQESNDSGVAMMATPSTEPHAPPTFKTLANADTLPLLTPLNQYAKPHIVRQRSDGGLQQQMTDKRNEPEGEILNAKVPYPVQSAKPQVYAAVLSCEAVQSHSQPPPSENGSVHQSTTAPQVQRKDVVTVNKVIYKILKIIGKGGSSKVYQVFNEGKKKLLAIKYVNLDCADDMTIQGYINEISLLQKLRKSENIIHLYDYEITDSHMYLVMECGSIDLATFLSKHKKIDPRNIKFYWRGMLDAVDVVHQAGIIHSDLKPANFLFVEGTLKLIDFGIANAIQSDKTSIVRESQVGTLNYMSPEAIQDTSQSPQIDANGHRRPRLKINCKSDVWSLGCIFYYMVYGKTPFQHITMSIVKLQAICDPKHIVEFPPVENPHLLDLLKQCLLRDPRQRPSIQELKQHPYFQDKAPVVQTEKDACKPSSLNLTEEHLKNIISQLSHPEINSPNSITAVSRTLMEQLQTGKQLDISTALRSKVRPFQPVAQQPPPNPPPPPSHQPQPSPLDPHPQPNQRIAVTAPCQTHRIPLQVVQMDHLKHAQSALKPLCNSQSSRYMRQDTHEKENRDLESVLRGQLAHKYQNAIPVTEEATFEQTWGTETLK